MMENLKNLIAFIKNDYILILFALTILGCFNGYIALVPTVISILIVIINIKHSASLILYILTAASLLISIVPIYQAMLGIDPDKHNALRNVYLAIQDDADRCEPGNNEDDKDIWLKIKEQSIGACITHTHDEQRNGIKKLQVATWGILGNSFSLVSTLFPDNSTQDSACLKLLHEYKRICPQVPGSKFDKEWEDYKMKYLPETTRR